jgi:hypothetical protein
MDFHELDVKMVARRVLRDLVEAELGDRWGNYPEIGEDDWQDVMEKVKELVEDLNPDTDVFTAAYGRLEQRATSGFDESEVVGTL